MDIRVNGLLFRKRVVFMSYYIICNGELYHHGIKGQKWGVRRFQDKNGRLTAAGKERRKSTRYGAKESTSTSDRDHTLVLCTGCGNDKKETSSPESTESETETILYETVITESILEETILEEEHESEVYISDEYLAELEFNSEKNVYFGKEQP